MECLVADATSLDEEGGRCLSIIPAQKTECSEKTVFLAKSKNVISNAKRDAV